MNKIELFPKSTLRISKHNRRAVSDIVAVLILIVIAIVGAVAVALILNSTSHSVQQQAQGAGNGEQGKPTLYIGGSTTLYPATLVLGQAWGSLNGANVNVQQGGSSTGMVALHQGVIDIGESSDLGAVQTAQKNYPNDNLQSYEVGGSGVVVITHTGAGTNLLSDGANDCQAITQAALKAMYTTTASTFTIPAASCNGAAFATLPAAGVTAGATITIVTRSDASGTADAFAKFIGVSNQAGITATSFGASGNAGVLAKVQSTTPSIGFVDLAFAETSGLITQSGIAIPGVITAAAGTKLPGDWTVAAACNKDGKTGTAQAADGSLADNCFVASGGSTSALHNRILDGLKSFTVSPTNAAFPDNGVKGGNPLARTFYFVTKGPAAGLAQSFILYATGPDQQHFWTDQGYFSVYQFS